MKIHVLVNRTLVGAGAALLAAVSASCAASARSAPSNVARGAIAAPADSGARRQEDSRAVTEARTLHALRDTVQAVLAKGLADSAYPGAYTVVGTKDHILLNLGVGHLDWKPSPAPDENTLWDLASLTKVVGMTTAMMQLVEAGRVELDAPVQRYLPEWRGPRKERVTVRHLLTHSSGLPPFVRYFLETTNPDSVLARVYATPLDTIPGARMVYSDIGAILAGQIVQRVSGERIDDYLSRHVFGPLGMTSTLYRPDSSLRSRIAPTEFDPWRKRQVWGEVHDENAYALGGVSSHAGLFSSAHDLARFAQMYLRGGRLGDVTILRPETITTFTRVQDPAFSNRALGWEVPNGSNSAGHRLSAHAFGHTGFTGTSIWIDPDQDVFVVLLTNRVNPSRENRRIVDVRIALADAVLSVLAPSSPASHSAPPSSPSRP
jgi:CubicO group peptidase (beta-lactamase class C family)